MMDLQPTSLAVSAPSTTTRPAPKAKKASGWQWFSGDFFTARSDGILVRNNTTQRDMMPFILRTRGEAEVDYCEELNVEKTMTFLDQHNATHPPEEHIKLLDMVVAAIGRATIQRPGMVRFVKGGRIYDRKEQHISFSVKREFTDYTSVRNVKFKIEANENFMDTLKRLRASINTERTEKSARPIEREMKWFLKLPTSVLQTAFSAASWLDAYGMLPGFLTQDDPLFASVFVANLGSLGLKGRVQHHLFEWGTVGLFCVMNSVEKKEIFGPNNERTVARILPLNWKFDERTNDAHYCAESLTLVRDFLANPETLLAPQQFDKIEARLQRDRASAQAAQDMERPEAAPAYTWARTPLNYAREVINVPLHAFGLTAQVPAIYSKPWFW